MTRKLLMTASTFGHIKSFHLPYLREFQNLNWQTHVACAGDPECLPYIDRAIELPLKKRMYSLSNFRTSNLLRSLILREKYDLVITHTSLAAFFTRFAMKHMRQRPLTVYTAHGYLFDDDTPYHKRRLLLSAECMTAPETDLLLTMNQWDFELAKRYHLGKQIEQIPGMGVDFSRLDRSTYEDGIRLRKTLKIERNAFVLLYAAEFSTRKSQRMLIQTMAKLPHYAILVLCGTGEKLDECKRFAKNLQLENRVLFPGQIAEMGAWYRMADAVVTSSRSEGLPFNVMEAMHMDLPVVASAVKGHVDLIRDGETGLLYPYGNCDACAKQLKRLMDDSILREKIRTQGRISVDSFSLSAVLPEVMGKYLLGTVKAPKRPQVMTAFR